LALKNLLLVKYVCYARFDTMRLFVALDICPGVRDQIRSFADNVRHLAPAARWVSADSLHVTLKFIGEKPDDFVKQIEHSLSSIRAKSFELHFRGTGFFPTPRSARVFWIGIQGDNALARLATKIEDALNEIHIPRENRPFSPHLTLARAGSGAPGRLRGDKPNRQFAKLQEYIDKHPAPDFGTISAREFFLYRSQLSPKGSKYTKLARFELQPPSD